MASKGSKNSVRYSLQGQYINESHKVIYGIYILSNSQNNFFPNLLGALSRARLIKGKKNIDLQIICSINDISWISNQNLNNLMSFAFSFYP